MQAMEALKQQQREQQLLSLQLKDSQDPENLPTYTGPSKGGPVARTADDEAGLEEAADFGYDGGDVFGDEGLGAAGEEEALAPRPAKTCAQGLLKPRGY